MAASSKSEPQHYEDGYEVVRLRFSWASTSLLLFALSLPMPFLLRWIPWRPPAYWMGPVTWVPIVFVLTLLGSLCGYIGYRRSPGNSAAKLGLLLNSGVLGLLLLFALAVFLIFSVPR